MNAVIACGGTGGHLFPGIAVAEVLRDRGHEVMLLVSAKGIDALALSGREYFRVERLPIVGLLSPFCPRTNTEVTGTPVRTELVHLDQRVARQKIGQREDVPTLLGMGGSQGASGINQAMIKALTFLRNVPLQVIHLSGVRDERLVADNYRRENVPAQIAAFHHRMEEVYSAADVVVARSGAASLAEFAAFSLPGILIPFPYATDDHQTRNAEIYTRVQAAILLKES